MKAKFYYMLLILTYAALFVALVSSCSILKENQKNVEKTEEHHYHDSTFVIERETIREVYTNPDSTTAEFDLKELIEMGYAKSTDRYFTTEIRYRDNNLQVTTSIDSLLSVIRELETEVGNFTSTKDNYVDSKTKNKEKTVQSSPWQWLFVILVLLSIGLFLFLAGRFVFKKLKAGS